MVEAEQQETFISTDKLLYLIESGSAVKILNSTCNYSEGEEDPLLEHSRQRIKGAQFLDLRVCRDLTAPYPYMMPSTEHFTLIM